MSTSKKPSALRGTAETWLRLSFSDPLVEKWVKEMKLTMCYGGQPVTGTFREILKKHGLLKREVSMSHYDDAMVYMASGLGNPCREIVLGETTACKLEPADTKEQSKMPNIATLLRLADKSLEKDLAEFGELPLDVQAALKDEIAAEKAEASKAAAA